MAKMRFYRFTIRNRVLLFPFRIWYGEDYDFISFASEIKRFPIFFHWNAWISKS